METCTVTATFFGVLGLGVWGSLPPPLPSRQKISIENREQAAGPPSSWPMGSLLPPSLESLTRASIFVQICKGAGVPPTGT